MGTETVTSTELHRATAHAIDVVRVRGDHVVVTRRKKPVVRLVPAVCRWREGRAPGGMPISPMGYLAGCSGDWWCDDDALGMDFCPRCAGKIVLEGDDD